VSYDEERYPDAGPYAEERELEAGAERRANHEGRIGGQHNPFAGEVVDELPCQVCKTMVELTSAGLHAMQASNEILRKRGEEPIDPDKVLACLRCRALRNRKIVEHLQRVEERALQYLRLLRDGNPNAIEEREAAAYIRKHCSCGDDIVEAVTKRRRAKAGGKGQI
jgi:hypothetical protein